MQQIVIVSVQGLIGAGKTIFTERLSKYLHDNGIENEIAYEPVKKWIEIKALDALYSNPERMAYAFQSYALTTRVNEIKEKYELLKIKSGYLKVLIMDRDNDSDKIFATLLKDNMTNIEFEMYKTWYDSWKEMLGEINNLPKIIVVIGTSVQECSRRIINRGREVESNISEEYQSNLLRLHENYYIHNNLVDFKRDEKNIIKWVPIELCNSNFKENDLEFSKLLKFIFNNDDNLIENPFSFIADLVNLHI